MIGYRYMTKIPLDNHQEYWYFWNTKNINLHMSKYMESHNNLFENGLEEQDSLICNEINKKHTAVTESLIM